MHSCPGRYLLELLLFVSNGRKLEDQRLQAALDGVAAQVLCVEGVLLPEQGLRSGQSLSRGLLEISAGCWRHEPTPDWGHVPPQNYCPTLGPRGQQDSVLPGLALRAG